MTMFLHLTYSRRTSIELERYSSGKRVSCNSELRGSPAAGKQPLYCAGTALEEDRISIGIVCKRE